MLITIELRRERLVLLGADYHTDKRVGYWLACLLGGDVDLVVRMNGATGEERGSSFIGSSYLVCFYLPACSDSIST